MCSAVSVVRVKEERREGKIKCLNFYRKPRVRVGELVFCYLSPITRAGIYSNLSGGQRQLCQGLEKGTVWPKYSLKLC